MRRVAPVLVFVAAMIAFRVAHARLGEWVIDDAGITYAAAVELVDHHSVGAYPEGTPVETYSNPLVFFTVALLREVGVFDPVSTHVWLEALLFGVAVSLCWSIARMRAGPIAALLGTIAFATLELATASTWLWSASGLENLWVSTGLVAVVWLWHRRAAGIAPSTWSGVPPVLLAIARPDAPVYAAAFYVALLALARPADERFVTHLRRLVAPIAVSAVLVAIFVAWRWRAYGDLLPNTYYAKMWNPPHPLANMRSVVIPSILPYYCSRWLALGAFAVAIVPGQRRRAAMLAIMLVASLALPITAGVDFFMGENRYGTAFFTMAHLTASLAIALGASAGARTSSRVAAAVLGVVVIVVVWQRHCAAAPYADPVTIPVVARLQGGQRWEHQMRLGVPNAVVELPDAGGSLYVGGFQLVDNAYLADFDLAHMGRYLGAPALRRQFKQYVFGERVPDLASDASDIGVVLPELIGTDYLHGAWTLLARHDLVETTLPDTPPIYADAHLRIYASDETVAMVAPGGLARYELVIAWTGGLPNGVHVEAAIAGGERDDIALSPYRDGPSGIEKRAVLLSAPPIAGPAAIEIAVRRDAQQVARGIAGWIDVTTDVAAAADAIVADPSPGRAMRRLAWLREQQVPRFGMARFGAVIRALVRDDTRSGSHSGANIERLRYEARLAHSGAVSGALEIRELEVAGRMFATCDGAAARIECLGRVVDDMRRMGYLGILDRAPDIAAELHAATLPRDERERYLALVGLTFAFPSDITLRRQLIATRKSLADYPQLRP